MPDHPATDTHGPNKPAVLHPAADDGGPTGLGPSSAIDVMLMTTALQAV